MKMDIVTKSCLILTIVLLASFSTSIFIANYMIADNEAEDRRWLDNWQFRKKIIILNGKGTMVGSMNFTDFIRRFYSSD